MKKIISWYNFGAFILFIGLLWMFLPHAFHEKLISSVQETSHITHTFEGAIVAVGGIILMIFGNKKS